MPKKTKKIVTQAEKIRNRDSRIKTLRIGLLALLMFLIILYFLLNLYYAGGPFTVILDQDLTRDKGIILFENLNERLPRMILAADRPEYMTNISIHWLPDNIGTESEGGNHNGEDYLAYTFFLENLGLETHYWYTIVIDEVLQNVDESVRVMVYMNGERTVYAKMGRNGEPEPGTVPFHSEEFIVMQRRENMRPGDVDRFTIVIWIEGDDPDTRDEMIGGAMRMHMRFTSQPISPGSQNNANNEENGNGE